MNTINKKTYLAALALMLTTSNGIYSIEKAESEPKPWANYSVEDWYNATLQKPISSQSATLPSSSKPIQWHLKDYACALAKGFVVTLFAPVVDGLHGQLTRMHDQGLNKTTDDIVSGAIQKAKTNPLTAISLIGSAALGFTPDWQQLSTLGKLAASSGYALVGTANGLNSGKFFVTLAKGIKPLTSLDRATQLSLVGLGVLTMATPAAAAFSITVSDPVKLTPNTGGASLAATSDGGSISTYKDSSNNLLGILQSNNGTIINNGFSISVNPITTDTVCSAGFTGGGFFVAYKDVSQVLVRTFNSDGTPIGAPVNARTASATTVGSAFACTSIPDNTGAVSWVQNPPAKLVL